MKHVVSQDGTQIGYVLRGSGPPLLLVHGTAADHTRWAAVSPRFERHFTVVAMDRRGRGGSGDAPEYDLMREAEDIAAVVASLAGPVNILGHSYGAVCSLEAALLTDQVRRLVLYEPPMPAGIPFLSPGVAERIKELADVGRLEDAIVSFLRNAVRMPEHELAIFRQSPVYASRIPLAPTLHREISFDETYTFDRSRFAHLRVPTLLLFGADSLPPWRQAVEHIHSALPDSRLVALPGQRHIAMDTNPELFAAEVLRFLL